MSGLLESDGTVFINPARYIVCVLTWSLLGVKKAWATFRAVSFRGLIQNFGLTLIIVPLVYNVCMSYYLDKVDVHRTV